MLAVRTSIGQSRPRRIRAKTLGLCTKGSGGVSTGLNNLVLFTLLDFDNQTSISTLSSDFTTKEMIYETGLDQTNLVKWNNDTMSNIEEYRYGRPDDWNEETDGWWVSGMEPNNPDSDYDDMPDGYEIGYGLNPSVDDSGVSADSDTLTNLDEYNIGTDPTNPDTDNDGLDDDSELGMVGTIDTIDDSWDGSLDPLNPDTDGDGHQDGKEDGGYEATYFVRRNGENKEKTHNIDSCPLKAYQDTNGEWIDTDFDNIPDVVEQDPVNISDIKDDDRFDLPGYDNYSRFMINHPDELDDQFNPNVLEPVKPETDRVDIDKSKHHVDITVDVMDPSGIEWVKIIIKKGATNNHKDSVFFYGDEGEEVRDGVYRFSTSFTIGKYADYYNSFKVKIKISDGAHGPSWGDHNEIKVKEKITGVIGGVVDGFVDLVASAFSKALEAAKGLANMLIEFLKDKIGGMINQALNPIIQRYEMWKENLLDISNQIEQEFLETGDIPLKMAERFLSLFGGTLLTLLFAIAGVIIAAFTLANALTAGSVSVLSLVLMPVVTVAIFGAFAITQRDETSIDVTGVDLDIFSLFDKVKDIINSLAGGTQSESQNSLMGGEHVDGSIKGHVFEFIALITKSFAVIIEYSVLSTHVAEASTGTGKSISIFDAAKGATGDPTGIMAEIIAIVSGIFCIILGYIGWVTHTFLLSLISIILGVISFASTLYSFRTDAVDSGIPEIMAATLSGIGVTISLLAFNEHYL